MMDLELGSEAKERACGVRSTGAYIEIPTSPNGMPIEWFLLDSPWDPRVLGFEGSPAELFANKKAMLYADVHGINHVIDWVGSDYPYVTDFIEEGRRMGFSRKIPPNFPIEKLTVGQSTMLCIHPRCYNDLWAEQQLPSCKSLHEALKHPSSIPWQEMAERVRRHEVWDGVVSEDEDDLRLFPADGPCLWKCYHLVPKEAGTLLEDVGVKIYRRKLGKTEFGTTYQYVPTGESHSGLRAGFFARLPIPIITFVNGNMQEREREQWEANQEKARAAGFKVKRIRMEYHPELGIDVEVPEEGSNDNEG